MSGPVLQPAQSFEWVRVIDAIDFETAAAVQKLSPRQRPAARTIAGVAYRLAWWADGDGTNLRPSMGRIAVTCRIDFKTAQAVMSILRDLGLLELVSRGGGAKTAEYRLTVPSDLLERVRVRAPGEVEALIRAASPRRRATPDAGGMQGSLLDDMQGGCPDASPVDDEAHAGGMPPETESMQGGCRPHAGGMPPPHRPETYQPTTPTKTSPQASTSPARASPDVETRAAPAHIAALRASVRPREDRPACPA